MGMQLTMFKFQLHMLCNIVMGRAGSVTFLCRLAPQGIACMSVSVHLPFKTHAPDAFDSHFVHATVLMSWLGVQR